MTIRPAFPADIEGIRQIGDGVVENLEAVIEHAFVAVYGNGEIASVAVALPEDGVHYLAGVATKPFFRRLGYASRLIAYIREAVETPLVAIVKPHRESFYAQLGFTPAGRVMEKA